MSEKKMLNLEEKKTARLENRLFLIVAVQHKELSHGILSYFGGAQNYLHLKES